MDWNEYTKQALSTESVISPDTPVDFETLKTNMRLASNVAVLTDQLKRSLFYGLPFKEQKAQQAYQEARFYANAHPPLLNDPVDPYVKLPTEVPLRLMHGLIGISGEAGEIAERAAKIIEAGTFTAEDRENLCEEIGDVLWYIALTVDYLGVSFEKIQNGNIKKLAKRFDGKFSQEAVVNRDTVAEMEAMTKEL